MKVYVTEPSGLYVDHLGHRAYGEFFEVDQPTATELARQPGLSLDDPRSPKRANKVKEDIPDVRSE